MCLFVYIVTPLFRCAVCTTCPTLPFKPLEHIGILITLFVVVMIYLWIICARCYPALKEYFRIGSELRKLREAELITNNSPKNKRSSNASNVSKPKHSPRTSTIDIELGQNMSNPRKGSSSPRISVIGSGENTVYTPSPIRHHHHNQYQQHTLPTNLPLPDSLPSGRSNSLCVPGYSVKQREYRSGSCSH